ncbi:hypothetical protein MSG_00892 [Mycobacterium shigaense]|uniref:Uncharacterized protein n=1 Tax=Mycobacterium shigaense TaxID=722731 RepID=A0A1Z4EDK0_9MYCO|nr:hypothetical protein B2J96_15710 [Mycobacterium shigaense]BAX91051.1 hypothetical protein MSG_00892 [Mycobacterium shigaense]
MPRFGKARVKPRASRGDTRRNNWLGYVDNGLFTLNRAIGRNLVMQCLWIFDHAVDLEGLRTFHHNLGLGLLGRRIECSPLKFARNRWVFGGESVDIDIVECARPYAEVRQWADERSLVPIDPERGPGWHLGVLPLTDGSTAVSLVCSHHLIDGFGLIGAVLEAVSGTPRDLGVPPPHSRTRWRAVFQDARRTLADVPDAARAVAVVAKQARRRRDVGRPPVARPVIVGGDDAETIVLPTVTIKVSVHDWEARANALGGTTRTLVAGLAAKLAQHLTRQRADDGAVTLSLPIVEGQTEGQRTNAPSFVTTFVITKVDPTLVTTDLGDVRGAIKQGLETLRRDGDDSSQYLRLVGFKRKRSWKRMFDASPADVDATVICSYLGEIDPAFCRLDGTDSDLILARLVDQHEHRQVLERTGGQMIAQAWHLHNTVCICVNAYQPGAENTQRALRDLAVKTLADFGLTGQVD